MPLEEADIKDISLKELKDKTLNQLQQSPKDTYTEYKIEKIEDYNKKAEMDTAFVKKEEELEPVQKLVFEELNATNNPIRQTIKTQEKIPNENNEDEWEITFEVRDN